MSTFEEDFLAGIASQLGLTPEQLTRPYPPQTPAERSFDLLSRYYEAEARGRYMAAITNAALSVYIDDGRVWGGPGVGWLDRVEVVCGYNPQKLLPHIVPNYNLWDRETLAGFIAALPISENVFESFFPKPGKPTRYYIEGGHFDMYDPGTFGLDDEMLYFDHPPVRHLAPFVMPKGRISYPDLLPDLIGHGEAAFTVEAKWPHKMAVIDIERFNSPDFSAIELRALLASEGIRSVFIDAGSPGGEIAGNPQLDLYRQIVWDYTPKPKVAKKQPKSYLKHDPTKQHRRRKRK